ncbi:MAG: UDP-N-acetylglucosamine 2-epimerase (non-hydrolyzing) [Candidatus Margulisbacteria bacterium]|nr:UDP-N-acetylglucosamine 2-epimerase (non-hydrolyzing) [Candidatus Margulisiibacteriota bacterium]
MTQPKKIMFVFGTRPEAIKMAPVIGEVKKFPDWFESIIVVTGQHRQMLDQVLQLFSIRPDHDLAIMEKNQSIAKIVAKTLLGLETLIAGNKPDILLVQGDTSTAFAAGLVSYYYQVPLGHVEAGLRTFDKWRPFPEEINRKLLTSLSDLHFAPTKTSVSNLLKEAIDPASIFLTGNTVIDALLRIAKREYDLSQLRLNLDPKKKMILVTMHRRESFGGPLEAVCRSIARLAVAFKDEVEIVLPVHQNPNVKEVVKQALGEIKNIKLIGPQEYEPFVHLMKVSRLILSDSGGVQEEGPSLGKPVLVMREKTERPEAVAAGTVKLVGMDEEIIFKTVAKLLKDKKEYQKMSKAVNPYGDGRAAERTVQALAYYFGFKKTKPKEFAAK